MDTRSEQLAQRRAQRRAEHQARNAAALAQEQAALALTPEERRAQLQADRERRRQAHAERNAQAEERAAQRRARIFRMPIATGATREDSKMRRGPVEDKMLRPGPADEDKGDDRKARLVVESSDEDLLSGVPFASEQAEALAREEQLSRLDFAGVQPSGVSGYTKGDVQVLVDIIRDLAGDVEPEGTLG